jgi:hypothetical protein
VTGIRAIHRVAFAVGLSIFLFDGLFMVKVRAPALSGPRTGPFERPWSLNRELAAPRGRVDIRADIRGGHRRQSRGRGDVLPEIFGMDRPTAGTSEVGLAEVWGQAARGGLGLGQPKNVGVAYSSGEANARWSEGKKLWN